MKIFLNALGYNLEEVKGKHHRIFCDDQYAQSQDYKLFWENLKNGAFESKEYRRLKKDGSSVWIQATYNPIMDSKGRPYRVIKFATIITEQKQKNDEYLSRLMAIDKVQCVIEFTPQGKILYANENFQKALGYELKEIQGLHHSIFCEREYAQSEIYKNFWKSLSSGEQMIGQFKRITKSGHDV